MQYPYALEDLIKALSKLPTVGAKSAKRMAFSMLLRKEESLALAESIQSAIAVLKPCPVCFALMEERCLFCEDPKRNPELLCIVEDASNIFSIEAAEYFRGFYHVLEGALSPMKGIGPENLRIQELEKRLSESAFKEVILATHPTIEGEATAHYLKNLLQRHGVTVSRLAVGVPNGADLELIDGITLNKAFSGRFVL